MAAWEYVAYQLALGAGVVMPERRIEQFGNHHHTFLTNRFDRTAASRLHFTSAMTRLGYYDSDYYNSDYEASYLELAQFLTEHGANSIGVSRARL